jgi:heme-degrading monooxygenase HmoA
MSGCRVAFGIGEAPVVRQGTVSIWESAEAMKAFAYRSPQHAAVVAATPEQNWYAEELFTRFALLDATGTIDGTAVA